MNDEILESVREGFAPVHMDRPLEAIEARGHAYRRNRRLTGLTGMGLAVGLGVALVLPTTDLGGHRDDNVAETGVSTPQPGQRMEHVSFTLTSAADGRVTVTFKEAAADPKALEKALADAGIPAVIRVNEWCESGLAPTPRSDRGAEPTPQPRATSDARRMPSDLVHMQGGDGTGPTTVTIDGAALPETVTLNLSLFVGDATVVHGLGYVLSVTGSPVTCQTWSISKATR